MDAIDDYCFRNYSFYLRQWTKDIELKHHNNMATCQPLSESNSKHCSDKI